MANDTTDLEHVRPGGTIGSLYCPCCGFQLRWVIHHDGTLGAKCPQCASTLTQGAVTAMALVELAAAIGAECETYAAVRYAEAAA